MQSDEFLIGITHLTNWRFRMNKLFSTLAATLMVVAFGANAADLGGTATADANVPGIPLTQTFLNKDGEIVFVESRENNTAFPAVVAALEGAGYRQINPGYGVFLKPGAKTDTWCRVDVYLARQILGECYTPQMGHGITVRNHLAWSQHSFKGDYSD
ncbi:MAG: hypothetical protein WBO92_03585, partial [Candidatus Moraniibacteriota bacterium]